MAPPFASTDHGFIKSSDDIEEGTTNQFFTQARAHASFSVTNTISPTYNGVTFLFGGLSLTNGTITYIPPPPSLIRSASFALQTDTGDLASGSHHIIDGNYDTISAVGANFITNGNDGTFTINTGGVYQIHFTLALSKTSTGSFLRAGRCKLLKNNIDIVQNHFLDSVSEMHEVSPSVNYLGSFAENDVITLKGQSNFSGSDFKALGIAGTSLQRTFIHFIKLS